MDTLQQHTNTVHSVHEQTLDYFRSESEKVLHDYMFDIPHNFSMTDYLVKKALSDIVCLEMECDFKLNECILEKISLHFSKR